jgi:catechol 2,3-dioxygenase-like lactoylglutathione lyase family enzyme
MKPSISGVHFLINSRDAEADRAFIRDVLGLDSVDSGGGWLIFALPPAEVAVHPSDVNGGHQLYLLSDDIEVTARELERKGVRVERPFREERWGRVSAVTLPSGGKLEFYQPKHALAPRQAR